MHTNYYDSYQNLPKFSDEFFGQFLRTLGKSYTQCADIGECFITLNKIKDKDFNSWYDAWNELACYLQNLADESWHHEHLISSAKTYLRATEYHRASEFFLRANLEDERILPCFGHMQYCFERSLQALHPRAKKVTIPYDSTSLGGYFFLTDKPSKATLIAPGGYDSTVEEMYSLVPAALQHGYNILIFDGPGQGHTLRQQRLYMRHDFEHVTTQVLDWLEANHDQIPYVLIGRSFGGYLAPRAACFEKRLAGLICDPGQMNIAGSLHRILPKEIQSQFEQGKQENVNAFFYELFSRDKMKEFYFLSRMNTHGVKTPYDYLQEIKQYTFNHVAKNIRCPTLVCDNPHDKISNRGNILYDALECDKTYVAFTARWGAGMHCEADGNGQFQRVMFDWLNEKFRPSF
ncbi:alpha/beta hydrolase [Legionella nagasakiensis]|uniref:alpha/beta hydrolase n=1 Tax=Legionella nagasakiensis TaxID=535290 RepID=UPI001055FA03|nr:alpha/beta fold hydrolase [Legionella nagasakiensis]